MVIHRERCFSTESGLIHNQPTLDVVKMVYLRLFLAFDPSIFQGIDKLHCNTICCLSSRRLWMEANEFRLGLQPVKHRLLYV